MVNSSVVVILYTGTVVPNHSGTIGPNFDMSKTTFCRPPRWYKTPCVSQTNILSAKVPNVPWVLKPTDGLVDRMLGATDIEHKIRLIYRERAYGFIRLDSSLHRNNPKTLPGAKQPGPTRELAEAEERPASIAR